MYPAEVTEQPLTGEIISERRTGETLPIGDSADVGAGGSVSAPTGEVGPTRNDGDEPLVLLIVVLASEIDSDEDDNSMVVEGTPPP